MDILPIFVGTLGEVGGMSGLVPAPKAEETNMFLRSDGSWAEVVTVSVEADGLTLENNDGIFSIAGFKDAPVGTYLTKNQDGQLGWVEPDSTDIDNLQVEVNNIKQILNPTDENGNPVEGGLIASIESKANKADVEDALALKADASEVEESLALKANIDDVEASLELKANISDIYTKDAADKAIAAAIADIDHLKREIVDVLPDIDSAKENIIYMIPNGLQEDDNKYSEWMVIDGVFESVGSWEVDLKNYATKENLQDLNDIVEEKADIVYYTIVNKETGETMEVPGEFLSPEDREKLAALVIDKDGNVGMSGSVNADNVEGLGTWLTKNGSTYITNLSENNISQQLLEKIDYITSVTDNFVVVNSELRLAKVNQSQVDGLSEALVSKASTEELKAVLSDVSNLNNIVNGYTDENNESVAGLVENISKLNTEIGNLENTYVKKTLFNSTVSDLTTLVLANEENIESLNARVDKIEDSFVWHDIEN